MATKALSAAVLHQIFELANKEIDLLRVLGEIVVCKKRRQVLLLFLTLPMDTLGQKRFYGERVGGGVGFKVNCAGFELFYYFCIFCVFVGQIEGQKRPRKKNSKAEVQRQNGRCAKFEVETVLHVKIRHFELI